MVKSMASNSHKEQKPDLIGIDPISAFSEVGHATLINWKTRYGFPMWKENEIFVAFSKDIADWFAARGVTPRTVSESVLIRFEEDQMRKAGKKIFSRKLQFLKEIVDFCGMSDATIINWHKYYSECPIEKSPDGNYTADCDDLYFWCRDMGFELKFNCNYVTPKSEN